MSHRSLSLLGLGAVLATLVLLATVERARAYTPPTATNAPTAAIHAKADAAQRAYALAEAQLKAGTGTVEAVHLWSQRWGEAQRALGAASGIADHLKRMRALEALVKTRVTTGMASPIETHASAFYVAEAEAM